MILKQKIMLPILLIVILLFNNSILATPNTNDHTRQFNVIREQKLKQKIDEVFKSSPNLLATYKQLQTTELSQVDGSKYQELLNSRELKVLNNSPEMQEALKEVINNVNNQIFSTSTAIDSINAQIKELEQELKGQTLSAEAIREIKKKIYAHEVVINDLKKGTNNALQSFNREQKLYFTDAKLAKNINELTPVQRPDTLTTDVLLTSIININQVIDARMAMLNATEAGGVASGDEATMHRLWVKGLVSSAKQSEYFLTPGYKLNERGVSIGLDFIDDSTIGLAYTFLQDHVIGNIMKEKINSHVATLYGMYRFNNKMFVSANAGYGISDIHKSRLNLNLSKDVSYAKTEGEMYGGKVELGYDYATCDNIHIVPSIGIGYDDLQIKKYREKGSGLNRSVGGRNVDKTTGLLGMTLSKTIEINEFAIRFGMNMKSYHLLDSNNDETTIRVITGADPLITPSNKLQKTIYKVGSSFKISKLRLLDIELGYDFSRSKKFSSHAGYISAGVTF